MDDKLKSFSKMMQTALSKDRQKIEALSIQEIIQSINEYMSFVFFWTGERATQRDNIKKNIPSISVLAMELADRLELIERPADRTIVSGTVSIELGEPCGTEIVLKSAGPIEVTGYDSGSKNMDPGWYRIWCTGERRWTLSQIQGQVTVDLPLKKEEQNEKKILQMVSTAKEIGLDHLSLQTSVVGDEWLIQVCDDEEADVFYEARGQNPSDAMTLLLKTVRQGLSFEAESIREKLERIERSLCL